jgi:hypothetical protein
VQLLVVLAPSLMPLIEPNAPPKASAVAGDREDRRRGAGGGAAAKPALQACGG